MTFITLCLKYHSKPYTISSLKARGKPPFKIGLDGQISFSNYNLVSRKVFCKLLSIERNISPCFQTHTFMENTQIFVSKQIDYHLEIFLNSPFFNL